MKFSSTKFFCYIVYMYSCHVLFDMLSKLLNIAAQYALNVVLSPCHLTAADQPDTPKVSFAILTANEREELAVNGFPGLGLKSC